MLQGQVGTEILRTKDGVVRLCHDKITCSYSIGLRTERGMDWRVVSQELYELLIEELSKWFIIPKNCDGIWWLWERTRGVVYEKYNKSRTWKTRARWRTRD